MILNVTARKLEAFFAGAFLEGITQMAQPLDERFGLLECALSFFGSEIVAIGQCTMHDPGVYSVIPFCEI